VQTAITGIHESCNSFRGVEVAATSVFEGAASIVNDALEITETAKNSGITLRIMGAVAIRIHCPTYVKLLIDLGRQSSDIDLMGYSREEPRLHFSVEHFHKGHRKYICTLNSYHEVCYVHLLQDLKFGILVQYYLATSLSEKSMS